MLIRSCAAGDENFDWRAGGGENFDIYAPQAKKILYSCAAGDENFDQRAAHRTHAHDRSCDLVFFGLWMSRAPPSVNFLKISAQIGQ